MPVLFCRYGDDDPYRRLLNVASPPSAGDASSTDTTIRVYEALGNELVNETNRDEVIDEIVAFVARLIGA